MGKEEGEKQGKKRLRERGEWGECEGGRPRGKAFLLPSCHAVYPPLSKGSG